MLFFVLVHAGFLLYYFTCFACCFTLEAKANKDHEDGIDKPAASKHEDEAVSDDQFGFDYNGSSRTNSIEENKQIEERYGVQMPQDFFDLWDFCKYLDPVNPKAALENSANLTLCGPYDFLSGATEVPSCGDNIQYHLHSRHYYDPPEFMTVLDSVDFDGNEGFHVGYWRDTPSSMPSLVATNQSRKNGQFAISGDNIFAALYNHLQSIEKQNKQDRTMLTQLRKKIKASADQLKLSLDAVSPRIKKRKKEEVVAPTFHKIGLCVPVDEKTDVGYRPLTLSDDQLRKLLDKIVKAKDDSTRETYFDELFEIVTLIQFANDECDYGMGLEFGMDLFIHGGDIFHKTILNILPLSYDLLGRKLYENIIQAHLQNRLKKPATLLTTPAKEEL